METKPLILGEFNRKVDDRNRLSLPSELTDLFKPQDGNCVLIKERPGCISLWEQSTWKENQDTRIEIIQKRMKLGSLNDRTAELQMMGRLLSTRERPVQLDARGRFLLPEGFREFLAVEPNKDVMVVGAMVCIEIWNPEKWIQYIENSIPQFQELITQLSG